MNIRSMRVHDYRSLLIEHMIYDVLLLYTRSLQMANLASACSLIEAGWGRAITVRHGATGTAIGHAIFNLVFICTRTCMKKNVAFFNSGKYFVKYKYSWTLVGISSALLCGDVIQISKRSWPCLNIKDSLSRYGNSHVKDKAAARTS